MTSRIDSQAIEVAMRQAGFSIKRTTAETVVWCKDLVSSYFQIYFGDRELYGAPEMKKWTLIYGLDDPGADDKFIMRYDLDLSDAIEGAKSIEAAEAMGALPGTPMPTTRQTENA
jgi:hypothetical protein